MPRPRKIVQEESNISDVIEVQEELIYVQEEETIEPEVELSPVVNIISEPEVFVVKETLSPTTFKVYHLGNYVEDVQENSNQLNGYLELNKTQLYDNIDKLKTPTSDPEDLALFNIPATDNRKYNSLAQYYQQNGLAPQPPRINNWMTYYKIKYSLATEEEIAIQVFGPLDYSFEIA
jgi:hypothetical protein